MITSKEKEEKLDFVEKRILERRNTKWRFKLIANVTNFAALLKNIPIGCPDSVLPEPSLRHTEVNCLLSNKKKEPYKDHIGLFRALVMYMKGHNDLDSHTSRYFSEFISKPGYDPKNFLEISVEVLPAVDELIERNIFVILIFKKEKI